MAHPSALATSPAWHPVGLPGREAVDLEPDVLCSAASAATHSTIHIQRLSKCVCCQALCLEATSDCDDELMRETRGDWAVRTGLRPCALAKSAPLPPWRSGPSWATPHPPLN